MVVGADAHIGPFANVTNLPEIAEDRSSFLLGRSDDSADHVSIS